MERAGQKAYKLCVWVLQEQLRLCIADLPDAVVIRGGSVWIGCVSVGWSYTSGPQLHRWCEFHIKCLTFGLLPLTFFQT
jgi:hypothetical protein